jgi:hypothetical protein
MLMEPSFLSVRVRVCFVVVNIRAVFSYFLSGPVRTEKLKKRLDGFESKFS